MLFVRLTEISQNDTTIQTIGSLFEKMGELYQDTGSSLFASWNNGRTFRIPSWMAIEAFNAAQPSWQNKADRQAWLDSEGNRLCGFIEFRGLPHANTTESKLRGFECSMIVLVEADLLTEADFQMAMPCLRWKGSDPDTCDENGYILDSSIIVETNPPSPRHWIARIEEETKKGEHPDYAFWHIKTAENAHNLPPGYVENLKAVYRHNPAMYARMVLGEYAEAFEGSPVYYAYNVSVHEGEDLPWPKGAYLVRGHDVGTNQATVFSAYWVHDGIERFHDLFEYYAEGSDTDRHAREVIRITESEFEFWNNREICAGVLDFIDPAAANSSYTKRIIVDGKQVNESAINIFRTYEIYPKFMTRARGLQETIAIVNRLFEKRDRHGAPVYRIDIKGCPLLARGFRGGYRWPNNDEPGAQSNVPLKGLDCDNLDHPQDASRYSKCNVLRILKAEIEEAKKPLPFPSHRNLNINPLKRR